MCVCAGRFHSAQVLGDITAAASHTIGPMADKAADYDVEADKWIKASQVPLDFKAIMKYTNDSSLNPNSFSAARWRWIWAIEKVISMNRISATMQIFFGGR